MTDNKRYRVFKYPDCDDYGVSDDVAEYTIARFDNHIEAEGLCKRLNDYEEENGELKLRYDVQRDFYAQLNSNYNNLYDEYKELKSIILNLFSNITELDWIREEYCNGVLGLFEKAESLDEARLMIKEYLE